MPAGFDKEMVIAVNDPSAASTVNWLLDKGLRVAVLGRRDTLLASALEKRIDDHLKRVAKDGKAYAKMSARLAWLKPGSAEPTDVEALFLSLWKKKLLIVRGRYGKTAVAVWAAHLIGDAVVVNATQKSPLIALDSPARWAIVRSHSEAAASGWPDISIDEHGEQDAAIRAARLAGIQERVIAQRLKNLPRIPGWQETVYKDSKITAVNDTTATSPEGGIAALERFGGPSCVLIAGGTDRELEFSAWAGKVRQTMRKNDIIFLSGSATRKMRAALGEWGRGIRAYDSLADAVDAALARAKKFVHATVLFSPSAHSFELFDNEYDRGRQFNDLIKELS